jgi:urease accessory protein
MHLSKPYLDGDTLLVNAVNPTAGLFAGDVVRCRVEIEPGARMLLTSPGAARIHRAVEGVATLSQHFTIRSGGFLEVFPEILIPQSGARYSQETRIELDDHGAILLIESIAPGRVAHGESFQFEKIGWATDVILSGRLLLRERCVLSPETPQLRFLRRKFPDLYQASVIAAGFVPPEALFRKIDSDLNNVQNVWAGGSGLVAGGFLVRILSGSSVDLRRCIVRIRELVYSSLDRMPPLLRRM